ncbi:Calx-beta domain-containing protein [Rhizobium ruizarguesonis]
MAELYVGVEEEILEVNFPGTYSSDGTTLTQTGWYLDGVPETYGHSQPITYTNSNTGVTYQFDSGAFVAFDDAGVEYDHDVGFGDALTGFVRSLTSNATDNSIAVSSTYVVFYMEGKVGDTIVSDTPPPRGAIASYDLGSWSQTVTATPDYFDMESGYAGSIHYFTTIWYDVGPAGEIPQLSIGPAIVSLPEGNIDQTEFTFTVTRSGDTFRASSVAWSITGTGNGPANADDFGGAFPSGTVTFAQGETSKPVTIRVTGDSLLEANEDFVVTLSSPSNATIGVGSAIGTILNDDALFTTGANTVDFNALSDDQKKALIELDDPTIEHHGLGGGDKVTLPNLATYASVGWTATAFYTESKAGEKYTITGGDGKDIIQLGDGKDTVFGSAGNDQITGGIGPDTFDYTKVASISPQTVQTLTGGHTTFQTNIDDQNLILLPGSADDYTFTLSTPLSNKIQGATTLVRSQTNNDGIPPGITLNATGIERVKFAGAIKTEVSLPNGIASEMIKLASEVYSRTDNPHAGKDPLAYEGIPPKAVTTNAQNRGWHELSAIELGIAPSDFSQWGTLHFSMSNGLYSAYDTSDALLGDPAELNAMVLTGLVDGKKSLALVFRGTDQYSDAADYPDFSKYYAKFKPLANALTTYISDSGIEAVYVSGHSLGGAAASYFMRDFRSVAPVMEFTAASPGSEAGITTSSDNILSFVNSGDAIAAATLITKATSTIGIAAEAAVYGAVLPWVAPFLATHSSDVLSEIQNHGFAGAEAVALVAALLARSQTFRQDRDVIFNSADFSKSLIAQHNSAWYAAAAARLGEYAKQSGSVLPASLKAALLGTGAYTGPSIQIGIGESFTTSAKETLHVVKNDVFDLGSNGDDFIYWAAGNHTIDGLGGDNTIVIAAAPGLFSLTPIGGLSLGYNLVYSDHGVQWTSAIYNIKTLIFDWGSTVETVPVGSGATFNGLLLASDGPLQGAQVFADSNGNGRFDPGESSTTTDNGGGFSLASAASSLVVAGGTDASTLLPFQGILFSSPGEQAITPLTSIAYFLNAQGVANANQVVLAALGIDPDTPVGAIDPVSAVKNGDIIHAQLFYAGVEVANVAQIFSAAVADPSDVAAFRVAWSAALVAMADAAKAATDTAPLDLTDVDALATLLANAASALGATLGHDACAGLSILVAAVNDLTIGNIFSEGGDTVFTQVSAIQRVVQGTLSQALEAAGGDAAKIAALISPYTGTGLDSAVAGATRELMLPSLALDTTSVSHPEGSAGTTDFTFTVTRSGDVSSTSAVDWALVGSGNHPADAADFGGSLPGGTVNFAAGETSHTISVHVAGDTIVEPDESFTVTLSTPTSATIAVATSSGVISNDDVLPPPALALAPATVSHSEGDTGTTDFVYTIMRTGDTSGASSVAWAVAGSGTHPVDAADFGGSLPSGSVNFAAGETNRSITLHVTGDTTFEPDEGFTVSLANATGATVTTASAMGTILNDDVGTPVCLDDFTSLKVAQKLVVDRAHGVLANDSDPMQYPLHVSAIEGGKLGKPIHGKYGMLTMADDGSFTYAASHHRVGQDVFTLSVDDGHGGKATETLAITVYDPEKAYVKGSPGPDTLSASGGKHGSVLDAGAGNDLLKGGAYSDMLMGGGGNNTLTGGKGSDVFYFNALSTGHNIITDFRVVDDRLDLDGVHVKNVEWSEDHSFVLDLSNGGTIEFNHVHSNNCEAIV